MQYDGTWLALPDYSLLFLCLRTGDIKQSGCPRASVCESAFSHLIYNTVTLLNLAILIKLIIISDHHP